MVWTSKGVHQMKTAISFALALIVAIVAINFLNSAFADLAAGFPGV